MTYTPLLSFKSLSESSKSTLSIKTTSVTHCDSPILRLVPLQPLIIPPQFHPVVTC